VQSAPLPAIPAPEFALTPGESLAVGLRRLSIDQFEHALEGFRDPAVSADVAVHEMRKATKRVRALLRMVRPAIGEKVFRYENSALRNASAMVAGVRDGAVMVKAVEQLRGRYQRLLAPGIFQITEERLNRRHQRVALRVLEDDEVMDQLQKVLYKARSRYVAWPVDPADPRSGKHVVPHRFSAIGPGIGATYARGRGEMKLAFENPLAENFHSWRKRVKYLRHQMEIVSPLWWEVVGGLATSLDTLGDVLGEEHDLSELTRLATSVPDLVPDPDERSLLVSLALQRRQELHGAARVIGRRIYAESPQQFTRRLGAYWRAWTTSD
jgi:CHAD domain-containing protein